MEEGDETEGLKPERVWGKREENTEGVGALRVSVGKLKRKESGRQTQGRPEWAGSGDVTIQE